MTKVEHSYFFVVTAFAVACIAAALFATPSPASAHNGLTGPNHHASSTKVVNLTCMQTAVDVRETAIGTAFDAMHSSVKSALSARKTALNTAWGMTDKIARNRAIKAAWMKWKTDNKGAHTTLRSERKKAWETFKKTVKDTCKETLPKEEALSRDTSGQISL